MLARSIVRGVCRGAAGKFYYLIAQCPRVPLKKKCVVARPAAAGQVRFGSHAHESKPKYVLNADGVVIPEIVDTLEWLLEAPVNVHQFEEPPVCYSFVATV